jgi:1-acyl-sn-glycerol-3-phosphate acyltransferase
MSALARMWWPIAACTIYHGLRLGTLSSVRAIDEGGLSALEGDQPIVIVANHQSHADTAVLHSLLPPRCRARVRFVASSVRFARAKPGAPIRERAERWLLHGLALHAYHAVLVGGELNGLRSVDTLTDALREGAAVAMYPEGTRSRDGALGPMKPGVAMLAIATGCAVVPVRLDGTREALPKSLRFPRLRNKVRARFRTPVVAAPGESHADFLVRIARSLAPPEPNA